MSEECNCESLKKIIIFLVKIRRTTRSHEMNVDELVDSKLSSGYHSINWIANEFASGVYFISLNVGGQITTQKIMLVK